MRSDQIKGLRERLGLSQSALAAALNEALGRKYSASTVSGWEVGGKSLPAPVSSFLDTIALNSSLPDPEPTYQADDPAGPQGEDSAPLRDIPSQPGPVPLSSSGAYKKACTELWSIVATGIGMAGAATGNQRLMQDGAIIDADKDALGEAWGKLAETNETFRNMLVGMTSGGAWLQVAVVTGTTAGRVWQNHQPHYEVSHGEPAQDGSQPEPAFAS